MSGVWVEKRQTASGVRYRVRFRLGGRETTPGYAGAFRTKAEALARKQWVAGELAALRVPDVTVLAAEAPKAPTRAQTRTRWQESRVDVRDSTTTQHRTALGRVLPELGGSRLDEITKADVAELVGKLTAAGYARESIRKSL